MGQRQAPQARQVITLQQVEQSIHIIFEDSEVKFIPETIALPMSRILQNLQENIPAQKTQTGFVLNLKMIRIFYHTKFLFAMGKLINSLMDKLEEIMQRNVLMIHKDQWLFCLNLANFIIFFSDDKLIRMMETVSIRNDLSEQSKRFIEKLQKDGFQFEATQSLIDKFTLSQLQRIQKCLRISLNHMITMRTKILTRSQQTLKVIQRLQQACFMLYLKVLYSPQHSQAILGKAKHPQFLKSNLNIGHYFLGKGSDLIKPSIYQSAVLFLFNLIQKNKSNLKQFKGLPSHLFKNLPIVSQNTVYDFIMNICLFSLTYVKEGSNVYSRMTFNRLMTLKLLDILVKEVKVSSPQITYYIEQICLQTKIGMIERSFVTDLVQNYMNIVHQTIQKSKKKQSAARGQSPSKIQPVSQISQTVSKMAKQTRISQILTKYLQSGKQQYNVKYSNKKFKITTVDIITQLQNDQNIMQTQFRILCQKYIYQVILNKRVIYQYNERQIWNQILPNILQDKDLSGDQIEQKEDHMQRQRVIGQRPVVSQVHTPKKGSNNNSWSRNNQSSIKKQNLQTQELGMYQMRTEQSKEVEQNNFQNKIIMVSQNLNMNKEQNHPNDEDHISEEQKPEHQHEHEQQEKFSDVEEQIKKQEQQQNKQYHAQNFEIEGTQNNLNVNAKE